jgi:predicted ATPase
VIGHVCSRRLLMHMVAQPEAEVSQRLTNLQAAELLYEQLAAPEPMVTFKHVLTQEVAYHTLSQARQRALHEQIAQAIEVLHSERLAERYGELAHHYSCSGNTQQAVAYLQRAGQQAADQSAYGEAIIHLTRGLELLQSLPEAPERTRRELDVHIALGWALITTKGQAAPDVEQAFTRARALCEQVGETPQLFAVLGGLRMMYEGRGELQQTRELAEQLLSLAQREQHPGWLMRAYNGLGTSLFHLGEFALARTYLDQAMALDASALDRLAAMYLSDPIRGGSRLGVSLRRHTAWALWYLGYPEQARQRSDKALTLAQELAHPYSLAYALYFATMLHCWRREAPAAQTQAKAMIVLARQQEFPAMEVRGTFLRGWALAAQGQRTEGMAQMCQGMEAQRKMGMETARLYQLALLAEASAWVGQTAEALRLLDEALALTYQYGGHFYQAEVYRLIGEVLRMQEAGGGMSGSPAPELPTIDGHGDEATGPSSRPTEAETWFRQALDVARRQQAKSLELRAAMSLSRLWQRQGKRKAAYELLAPIYGWFTEGFDTADLQEAKVLLETLS